MTKKSTKKVWYGDWREGFYLYNVVKQFFKDDGKYLLIDTNIKGEYYFFLIDVGNYEIYPSNPVTDKKMAQINKRISDFNAFKKTEDDFLAEHWLEFCDQK